MKRIPAPIDNKNLMEDPFEDEVFKDFYAARDHNDNRDTRHLVGHKAVKDERGRICEEGLVDVRWKWGGNFIRITLLAVPFMEDWEYIRSMIFDDYKKTFKGWECEDNPDLVVSFYQLNDSLTVIFDFECED